MQRSDDLQSVYPDCIKIVRIIFSVILYPAEKNMNSVNNNISEGLPIENKPRQKQYDYYRNRLLTFHCFNIKEKSI